MKRAAVIHHLAHVASLGLGDRLAIPLMMDTVSEILPAQFLNFIWLDANEQPCDIWLPRFMREPLRVYFDACDRMDPSREPTIRSLLAAGLTIGANERWNRRPDFHDTILYNETLKPYGIGAGLDLVLRRGARARGILFVNRERRFSRFSEAERQLLLDLEPLFLRALDEPAVEIARESTVAVDRAVMLVSPGGDIVFASETASLLAHQFADDLLVRRCTTIWRKMVAQLAAPGRIGRPPTFERATRWGTLTLSAMPPAPESAGGDLTAIMLERRVPREVAILRRLTTTELSPREREVAFELVVGNPVDAPGRLGLTQATWRDYQKRIYAKLGVHSRLELTHRLAANDLGDRRAATAIC